MTIQRAAQIAIALLTVATFALSASNISLADDECEFGRLEPDNPLNTECRAVPESLGVVSIEFGIVADFDDGGAPRCRQSNRFVFADERLNQDLVREVRMDLVRMDLTYREEDIISALVDSTTTDNLKSHRLLGIWHEYYGYGLKTWNPADLVHSLPDIPSNAAHPFGGGATVKMAVLEDHSVSYSDPIPAAAFEFNWRAALVACAQQHQQTAKEAEAKKAILLDRQASDAAISTHQFIADSEVRIAQAAIDHYTAEIGKLEAALVRLETTLTEARTLYEDALTKQRRTIELRTRMSKVMADYYADQEKAYLAFGAWADQQLAVQNTNLNQIELSTAKIEEVQAGYAELLEETNAKLEEARAKLEEARP